MKANDKPDSRAEEPVPTRLLLTARQAAEVCGKSLRTWRTWDSLGLVPAPIRIGRSTMWATRELRQWVHAGCPARNEWDLLKPTSAGDQKRKGQR